MSAAPTMTSVKRERDYCSDSDFIIDKEEHTALGVVKMEDKVFDDDFIVKTEPEEFVEGEEGRQHIMNMKRRKLLEISSLRIGLRSLHIPMLGSLLEKLVAEHRWKEAAGVLSVLMKGTSSFTTVNDDEHRRNHVVAMELHKRFHNGEGRRYEMWIQQIYEEWMRKLSMSRKVSKKKNEVQMELAMFFFTQGRIAEAKATMKLVVENRDFANEPSVNLLYGMILYQFWYTSLPEDFQVKGSGSRIPFQTYGTVAVDSCQRTEPSVSSYNHCAVDMKDAKLSSWCASESSIGNKKILVKCKPGIPRRIYQTPAGVEGFYSSHSMDMNEQIAGSFTPDNNLHKSSIFFANGLDTSLLPINLPHLTGDIEQYIDWYRKLINEDYMDAVKHLKVALHSTPPVYATLLPLIQLLLLGDRVEEAFRELDKACHNMDTALPFRLMGRLLECFQSNKTSVISSCYENALKRDPLCSHSLEGIIKMQKTGNCSTMLVFEMITLHLDAADGKCSIWEEFAACFSDLIQTAQSEYEDRVSINVVRGESDRISKTKIPRGFFEGNVRGRWKLRFEWWKRRHFSSSTLSEQSGDQKLLCFKAACASHLYGPTYKYVIGVLRSLDEGDGDHTSILRIHMQNSMKLFEHL